MDQIITAEELIEIIEKSELDQTIKNILVRDIKTEGATEFLVDQVIAYCDNAINVLKDKIKQTQTNNPS